MLDCPSIPAVIPFGDNALATEGCGFHRLLQVIPAIGTCRNNVSTSKLYTHAHRVQQVANASRC
jgi:hypothetical protein